VRISKEGGIKMGEKDMDMGKFLPKFQKKMGYTDEEMAIWSSFPVYQEMIRHSDNFMQSRIIAEVIEARACMAGHEVGQKIVMDGNGVLLRDECPKKICSMLLGPMASFIPMVMQTFKDNVDPNGIIFPRFRCLDLGVERGGWGLVLCSLYVEGPLADKFRSHE
jgi:uncharacterized repeat protein (TIGR04076 family)